MVYAVNPTFVGTNMDASWFTDSTQALQSGLESNPVAHLATTSLVCGAVAAQANSAFERLALFVKCQVLVNGALMMPSFMQGVLVMPKMGTLLKTADTIYHNIVVWPLTNAKEQVISGATWLADKGYQLSNYIMTSNLSPTIPISTIFAMFKATRLPTVVGVAVKSIESRSGAKKSSDGLANRYVLSPMLAGILTNFYYAIPGLFKDLVGTPDSENKSSAFAQSVANLAYSWTNTGRIIVDLTNWAKDSIQSVYKRMRA